MDTRNLIFDTIEIIKMEMIAIFSERKDSKINPSELSHREVSSLFEFFKITDDLKDSWIIEWMNSIQCWNVLFDGHSATFIYFTKYNKPLAHRINSIENKNIEFVNGSIIEFDKLPTEMINKDEIQIFIDSFPWIAKNSKIELLTDLTN